MQPLPHRYTVVLQDGHLVAPTRASIPLGPPPQFGGTDRVWSPEELLVGAVLECLWTTFDAYARRAKLHYEQWSGSGIAVLERGPTMPVFTSISLTVDMMVAASEVGRAEQLLISAKDHCIIGNALNVPIAVFPSIRGEGIQDVA